MKTNLTTNAAVYAVMLLNDRGIKNGSINKQLEEALKSVPAKDRTDYDAELKALLPLNEQDEQLVAELYLETM